jgi:hypothetical protein
MPVRGVLPAPSPLEGEGWRGGWQQIQSVWEPPSLSLKGGGNAVALVFATRAAALA